MNKKIIQMPDNVRYMSEASEYLRRELPLSGKYILDKSLTGCGGTEFFISSGRPLVLISPRTGVLLNKSAQHPECHLFRDLTKCDLQTLKVRLRNYLDIPVNLFGPNQPSIILVTLDSAKYVIEELKYRGIIDSFLFLSDEFQCLVSDAAFKGDVELEYLKMLDAEAKNICYMSATPIDDTYLDALSEFQNVGYYKLEWDPNVIVEPTVKEVRMGKKESAQSIVKSIIEEYRGKGFFAQKVVNGQVIRAYEAVIFVNEVKTILQIIKNNQLRPDEVTLLISSSNSYVSEFTKLGFRIENQSTDRSNPQNTTFTFCSKASFEGRDFYSCSAFTYIFLDGTKDWEIHDISIDIPQMLGRQRLDANPFKYNAIIYYRTKSATKTRAEYMKIISDKMNASKMLVDNYNNGDSALKFSLACLVKGQDPNNRYRNFYLDVVDRVDGTYSLEINPLVASAEHNLWINKVHFYNNPLFLTTAIRDKITGCNIKSPELRAFEHQFNQETEFYERMRTYSEFRSIFPVYVSVLEGNPFIDLKYSYYYALLGPLELSRLNYNETAIDHAVKRQEIMRLCVQQFRVGDTYTLKDVKKGLQNIYNELGLPIKATASQLSQYMNVEKTQKTQPGGSREWCFLIKNLF